MNQSANHDPLILFSIFVEGQLTDDLVYKVRSRHLYFIQCQIYSTLYIYPKPYLDIILAYVWLADEVND